MKNKMFDREVTVVLRDGQSVQIDDQSWVSLDDQVYVNGQLEPRKTMISVHELLSYYIQNNTWVVED